MLEPDLHSERSPAARHRRTPPIIAPRSVYTTDRTINCVSSSLISGGRPIAFTAAHRLHSEIAQPTVRLYDELCISVPLYETASSQLARIGSGDPSGLYFHQHNSTSHRSKPHNLISSIHSISTSLISNRQSPSSRPLNERIRNRQLFIRLSTASAPPQIKT